MTDITANVIVSMPSQLFTMARSFKAVANGKIYIGKIDTDPVNPENQIQVYVENEYGSHVPVSQPIIINAAGYPVYNGQIAKFVTVQGHSMAVYDAYGAQQFYFPNVRKYDPDQLSSRLSSDDGASYISFKKPYADAATRKASDYFNQEINVDDFGAYGDAYLLNGEDNPSKHDDTHAFQAALIAAWRAGGVKVVATPWKSYYIAGKVYVLASESPSDIEATNFPKRRMQVLDFQGARIVGRDDTSDTTNVFIETGYITSTGAISSVFGKSGEEYLTIGTTIRNATLINFYQGFRLRDHVFGCEVTDIVGVNVQQLVYTQRCFYSLFRNLQCNGTYTTGLHRYHFTDECNIQPLISVHTGQCDVGIKFEGAVEALTLFNCGIESFRTHGVWIAGAYNIKFDSCYIESNESNVYGVIATSANNITLDNCWIYGSSMKMFGAFDDNTNVRIMPNNRIGGGAVWWDLNEGSPYNLSDIHWQTDIKPGGTTLPAASAKEASTVDQTIVFYNPDLGLSSVVGKAKQTSKYHPQLVNGKMSNGSSAAHTVGASVSTEVSGSDTRAKWTTQIQYSDTQLIFLALKIDHNLGTWFWLGVVAGDKAMVISTSDESKTPVISNENGFVVVESPLLMTPINVHGGEIRLL
ncbi:phage tailspike protein [Escherichia coli]|uniref:phage tailspike protein n=1 Tax=Escherichia coli TaxID=562 RepID=UPI001FF5EA00|nr:phage tailspike protein [Escherichia coli]MCK3006158.1 phage tailspike protein [Escherichia coli]MCK3010803.1 phage tailspike protein [Escherichia coli]MCK3024938.1 phage tailspike protein [Escherichia coli]MCK3039290.1 phage tailspike protein [Escherichia coli]